MEQIRPLITITDLDNGTEEHREMNDQEYSNYLIMLENVSKMVVVDATPSVIEE